MNYVVCKRSYSFKTSLHFKENFLTEAFFVEMNLRKKKWSFSCSYNPNRENIANQPETLRKSLALQSKSHKNLFIVGGFNNCVEEFCMSGILSLALSLIKNATSYKNLENSSSTDFMLTNNPSSLRNVCVIETDLSGYHRIVLTALRTSFEWLKSGIINHEDSQIYQKQYLSREIVIWIIKYNIWWKWKWYWRVYWHTPKNIWITMPQINKSMEGAIIYHLWVKPLLLIHNT